MSGAVVLGFGGCQLHGPLNTLGKRGLIKLVYKSMGLTRTPFSFTPRTALQLLGFCRGTLHIPPEIRRLCWFDTGFEPSAEAILIPDTADLVLLEPNTPVDIIYGDFALSQQEVKRNVEDVAEARYPQLAKAVRRWKRDGLYKANEQARLAAAAEILDVFRPNSAADEILVDVVREARGHAASIDELRRGVSEVRDAAPGKLGLVLYTMQFMPDGRPISWPADFKDNLVSVARDLDLPIYEPALLIAERGVSVALKDFRHYRNEFKAVAGDGMMRFLDAVRAGQRYEPIPEPAASPIYARPDDSSAASTGDDDDDD